jgi:outer membrane protein assembly factor BamE
MRLRHPALIALLAAASLLGGCGSFASKDALFGLVTPYRIDIVQGNVVTKEQAALLRPGLTRSQVRDLIGSPMLTDPFHGQRWDYIFTLRRQGTEPQRRSVIVHFDGDTVKSVVAPDLPSEREVVATIARPRDVKSVPPLELTEAQRKALPVPPARAQPPAEPVGPVRSYPPLES